MFNLDNVTIVAATKYVDAEKIKDLYNNGITNIGENRTEAFLEKYEVLKDYDITWHFIGTLQTRKVKQVINKISYLHSLDNLKLASEINKHRETKLDCFIEVNVTKEDTKHGVFVENLDFFIEELKKYDKINVVGLMTMAPNTDSDEVIKDCFSKLNSLKERYNLLYTSMGMSNDYQIAIECGATHVRLGRILFEGDGRFGTI